MYRTWNSLKFSKLQIKNHESHKQKSLSWKHTVVVWAFMQSAVEIVEGEGKSCGYIINEWNGSGTKARNILQWVEGGGCLNNALSLVPLHHPNYHSVHLKGHHLKALLHLLHTRIHHPLLHPIQWDQNPLLQISLPGPIMAGDH